MAVTNSQIQNNSGGGIRLSQASSVSLSGSMVAANAYNGVNVQQSEMSISATTITGNGTNPLLSETDKRGVTALASNVTITNSIVQNNLGGGVSAAASFLAVGGGTFTGNMGDGITLYLGATGNIGGPVTVSGNLNARDLVVALKSTLQLAGGSMTIPNIVVSQASVVWLNPADGPMINGTLTCLDGESSVNGSTRISGAMNCTGF